MSTTRKCDYCGKPMSHRAVVVNAPPGHNGRAIHTTRVHSQGNLLVGYDACLSCTIKFLTEARDAEKAIAEGDVAKDNAVCEALSEQHKSTCSPETKPARP